MRSSMGFDATRNTRRMSRVPISSQHTNSYLTSEGTRLRARAEDAARNNAYVTSAADSFTANLIGTGIKPSFLIKAAGKKRQIQQLWADWTDEADADGITDYYGLQALIGRALFSQGEIFARFRPRRFDDGFTVPLQIQLLPAAMVPIDLNRTEPGGRVTRMGIEFNSFGQRTVYWFYRNHPADSTVPFDVNTAELVPVPASEIMHIYWPGEPGQIRGTPKSAASIVRLFMLDSYDDHELERKRTAALFTSFVTKTAPDDALFGEEDVAANAGVADGFNMGTHAGAGGLDDPVAYLAPGMLHYLLPGESVENAAPADVGASYEPFQYRNLTASAAGMGVPYANMTGDLRATSYGSQRAGMLEFRRRLEQLQWGSVIYQFCRPVVQRWLDTAVQYKAVTLSRYLERRREYQRVKHITPAWAWIDPLKDMQAEQIAVQERWKARSDVIEATGFDAEEVDARVKADEDREAALGVVVPRPEAPGAPGAAPAQPPAPEPESEPEPTQEQESGQQQEAA
jgi:lambda family phage portal protein